MSENMSDEGIVGVRFASGAEEFAYWIGQDRLQVEYANGRHLELHQPIWVAGVHHTVHGFKHKSGPLIEGLATEMHTQVRLGPPIQK